MSGTGVLEWAAIGGLVYGGRRMQRSVSSRRENEMRLARQLHRRFTGSEIQLRVPSLASSQSLATGADPSATEAIKVLQQYQDSRPPDRMKELAVPSCICGAEPLQEVTITITEDLKVWLASAASGSASPKEIELRLEFCRQLLMRPDIFGTKGREAFLVTISTVCEHLESMLGRAAGRMQTCSRALSATLGLGKALLECVVSILLFSITSSLVSDDESPPASYLCFLVKEASKGATVRNIHDTPLFFGPLFATDIGDILSSLLQTRHFSKFWQSLDGGADSDRCSGVSFRDAWHRCEQLWASGKTENRADSGLLSAFQGESMAVLRRAYLDLVWHLDAVVYFFSVLLPYKRLADLVGDAAVYRLREPLHHILSELEVALVQMHRAAAQVMQGAKRVLQETAVFPTKQSTQHVKWMERLQHANEVGLLEVHNDLLKTLQELRFLSASERLPELQEICATNLRELADAASSQEFRVRCIMAPPSISQALSGITWTATAHESQDLSQRSSPLPSLLSLQAGASAEVALVDTRGAERRVAETMESSVGDNLPAESRATQQVTASRLPPQNPPPSQDEEDKFYSMLWTMATFGSDTLEESQAKILLDRSKISTGAVTEILGLCSCSGDLREEDFRAACRLIAHSQAGASELLGCRDLVPPALPDFVAVSWDGERVRVKVPLSESLDTCTAFGFS